MPEITVDAVASHAADLPCHHASQLHQCMIDALQACEVNKAITQHVTSKCKINDHHKRFYVDGELHSNFSCNIYFKNNFAFVFAIFVRPNSSHDATEAATYQYVRVLDS